MTADTGGGVSGDLRGVRLFISYPRGGRTHGLAKQVQEWLQAQGVEAFRDETHVREGDQDAIARIERELLRCQAIVYLLGADTAASTWQRREALLADRERVPLLVLQTERVALPFEVSEKQPLDATGPNEAWLPRLLPALSTALATAAAQPASGRVHWTGLDADRQAERAYLLHWLCGAFAERRRRYTALSGIQERCLDPKAHRRGLYHDTELLLEFIRELDGSADSACDPAESAARNDGEARRPVDDVFEAYQQVLRRRGSEGARLAILGDPGAGKTFSLQRLFVELADRALEDERAPIPLFVALGDWTKEADDFATRLDRTLAPFDLQTRWRRLRDDGRAVLLLDGLNEIPVEQRSTKSDQVFHALQDTRWAGVLVSCRERDFDRRPLRLPVDRLTLQPLTEVQILDFLTRWEAVEGVTPEQARARAQASFWALAAGPKRAKEAAELWAVWHSAGATLAQFWSANEVPREQPNVYAKTTAVQDRFWQEMRFNRRSLLRLAASPFWLELLAGLPKVPDTQARLIDVFLRSAHDSARKRCKARNGNDEVPHVDQEWLPALQALAMSLQGRSAATEANADDDAPASPDGTATRIDREQAPTELTDRVLEFSIAAQVLRETDGQVHFSHQLLQEGLAAQVWLAQLEAGRVDLAALWPGAQGWSRTGWEVVAELASQAVATDAERLARLLKRIAAVHPEQAARCWLSAGAPTLGADLRTALLERWLGAMIDVQAWPHPAARAAIGRAMGIFGLDNRPGVGVDVHDGLPDIAWVEFNDCQPFIYQEKRHKGLEPFALSRYLVTHRQFQAFVAAPDGYADPRWWKGFEDRQVPVPRPARWTEANCPRETVNWFEAVAFCRWLTQRLQGAGRLPQDQAIGLPTEHQWERAARGRDGWLYPTGPRDYALGTANCNESQLKGGGSYLQRTSAVGLYPQGATREGGLLDMAGNLWEWCADVYDPKNEAEGFGSGGRVLRGGSWLNVPEYLRASYRSDLVPDYGFNYFGFRVCRASPSESLPTGAAGR